jgi:hypothetical protein
VPKRKPEPAPLLGPQTRDEWVRTTLKAIQQKDVTTAAREEYRQLMEELPALAMGNGDLPTIYWRAALDRFESQPIIQESVKFELAAMRKRLAGESSAPLELLLIDAIVACFADFWAFNMIYTQKTISSFTLSDMEQWERVLCSKEARYLKAIETLARVRRLLKVPALQVNIAAAGGQQVNMAGG